MVEIRHRMRGPHGLTLWVCIGDHEKDGEPHRSVLLIWSKNSVEATKCAAAWIRGTTPENFRATQINPSHHINQQRCCGVITEPL